MADSAQQVLKPKPSLQVIIDTAVKQASEVNYLRKGQCLFNLLHMIYPKVANEIRGTNFDPFFHNEIKEEHVAHIKKLIEEQ